MRQILLLLLLFTAGCATSKNYGKRLDSWVGTNADELVRSWGAPNSSYEMSDKRKIISYFKSSGASAYTSYNEYGASTFISNSDCKTEFIVSDQNIIESWKFEGNACKARKSSDDTSTRQGRVDPNRKPIFCKYFKIGCKDETATAGN